MDLTGVTWRKSSRSGANGGNCVEVAAMWRKSSRSGANGGDCVEVAAAQRAVAVRDSKDPTGPKLAFDVTTWAAFVTGVKAGRYDVS